MDLRTGETHLLLYQNRPFKASLYVRRPAVIELTVKSGPNARVFGDSWLKASDISLAGFVWQTSQTARNVLYNLQYFPVIWPPPFTGRDRIHSNRQQLPLHSRRSNDACIGPRPGSGADHQTSVSSIHRFLPLAADESYCHR
jgi:hypothetical protein